jgi:hypothetical protein
VKHSVQDEYRNKQENIDITWDLGEELCSR